MNLFIYQTFKYLKTGVIEVVISILAFPGFIFLSSQNNQFSNGKFISILFSTDGVYQGMKAFLSLPFKMCSVQFSSVQSLSHV